MALIYQPDSLLFKWRPVCDECHETGVIFAHADDCGDELCALNGDVHSCLGQVAACPCTLKNTT